MGVSKSKLVIATMVNMDLIEVNSRILKQIEDNDEAMKRGVDCER